MCDPVTYAVLTAAQMAQSMAAQRQQIKAENEARRMNYERAKQIAAQDLRMKYAQEQTLMQEQAVAKGQEQFKVDSDLMDVIAEGYNTGSGIGDGYVDPGVLAAKHMASFRNYTDAVYAQDAIDNRSMYGRQAQSRTEAGFRAASAWKGQLALPSQGYTALKIGMAGAQGYMQGKMMFGDTTKTAADALTKPITGPGSGSFKPTVGVPFDATTTNQLFIPTW